MATPSISLPGEIWKPVVGLENRYEISNLGRIWSIPRPARKSGIILQPETTPKGYTKIRLRSDDGACTRYIHSLVLTAFVGDRPAGMEAAHLNGCPNDNRQSNLKWVTSRENKLHQKIHGTQPHGEGHHSATLNEKDVARIRELRRNGALWKDIAALFAVSQNTARNAGLGLTGFGREGVLPMETFRHRPALK